jgi:hypothetical protein
VLRLREQVPDVENLADHARRRRRRESIERFNPLSARVPLGSPMRLLARSGRLAPRTFGMPGLVAWLLLVLAAAGVLAGHWDALAAQGARWMDTPRYWLLSLPAFVVIVRVCTSTVAASAGCHLISRPSIPTPPL